MSALSWTRRATLCVAATMIFASCTNGLEVGDSPPEAPGTGSPVSGSAGDSSEPTTTDATPPESSDGPVATSDSGNIDIFVDGPVAVFDRRLLGTNMPAWLGPERLLDPDFQANAVATGTTIVRMPGGSWSNAYDWSACEVGDEVRCSWTWAARPSDFAEFMVATGLAGMWTVSINHTAHSAAGAVAFFNGEVGDQTVIGIDRDGVDWGTVDQWATLRSDNGHPDPVRIDVWEVGNEVYGGKKESGGPSCKSWGWEDVWTCDGTSYVNGDDQHDGYLAIRAAMREVDPTIEVGAVGVPKPNDWNNWGNEVIDAARGELDFYIVHQYGFESSPGTEAALRRAVVLWPNVVNGVRLPLGNEIPIAVTEYNLVAVESRDNERSMTQAVNALYIAESIGQFATLGVSIANQWNLANGTAANGTDYGLVSADDGSRFPQFEALATWSRAGTRLLPAATPAEGIRIYPTLHDDGRITLIVISRVDTATSWTIDLVGMESGGTVVEQIASADEPTATSLTTSTNAFDVTGSILNIDVPAWSISSIDVTPTT